MNAARPGLSCKHCHQTFALKDAAIGAEAVKALPDPFLLKCPLCGEAGMYAKASIGTLVTPGRHIP